MNELYLTANISKQAHWASVRCAARSEDRFALLSASMSELRGQHPAMSLKKMYHKLQPDFAGRDAFLRYGMDNGLEPVMSRKYHKTTHSGSQNTADNLLRGAVLFDTDQVWASDIFYFKVGGAFCYVTLIEDLYSRKILGHCAAQNMFAEANLAALNMALKNRGKADYRAKLIHHSDRGSQYRSALYTQKLQSAGIRISMGRSCYDNAFMESANGIIKNEYLRHRPIKSFEDLRRHLDLDIRRYNCERPHGSLHKQTPEEFERHIANVPIPLREHLAIYTDPKKQHNLSQQKPHGHQLKFQFPKF